MLIAVIALALSVGPGYLPFNDAPECLFLTDESPPEQNHFIVEVRVKFDGHWFRLDTGPRPEAEARILYDGLHDEFSNRPHSIMLIDLSSGEQKGRSDSNGD